MIKTDFIRMSWFFLTFAFLFAVMSVNIAHAQSFGGAFKGIGDNDEPIQIEADRLEVIDSQSVALFSGNVSVVQGSTILKAKQIKVNYLKKGHAQKSKSGISTIEINGRVAIESEDNQATADKAFLNLMSETATMTGNVVITQDGNVVEAAGLWVDLKTKHAKLTGRVIFLTQKTAKSK